MGTIPARVGSGRLTCDYNAISVQLQLQLPTGTELGNLKYYNQCLVSLELLYLIFIFNRVKWGGDGGDKVRFKHR